MPFIIIFTFANVTGGSSFSRLLAAFSNSGFSFLQWPHLTKENQKLIRLQFIERSSIAYHGA